MHTINCKGKLLSLETPLVMGIINATPDSFYKGDLPAGKEVMMQLAGKMLADGAAILDIGGMSTKPGSGAVSANEEMDRLIPVIESVHHHYPEAIISADTYVAEVAKAAVAAGAAMINDISGGELDENMIPVVAALKVPYICMHMKGTPATMQAHAHYDDVTKEVLDYFIEKIYECRQAGIKDVIIDPGFGFAKNADHNFALLKDLQIFKMLDKPILAGLSRKKTIYGTLGITAAEALNGTTVLNTLALQNSASILRVHDVKEAMEAVRLVQAYDRGR